MNKKEGVVKALAAPPLHRAILEPKKIKRRKPPEVKHG
jgi:hypothetical protein